MKIEMCPCSLTSHFPDGGSMPLRSKNSKVQFPQQRWELYQLNFCLHHSCSKHRFCIVHPTTKIAGTLILGTLKTCKISTDCWAISRITTVTHKHYTHGKGNNKFLHIYLFISILPCPFLPHSNHRHTVLSSLKETKTARSVTKLVLHFQCHVDLYRW